MNAAYIVIKMEGIFFFLVFFLSRCDSRCLKFTEGMALRLLDFPSSVLRFGSKLMNFLVGINEFLRPSTSFLYN